jgi:hypothetical protein
MNHQIIKEKIGRDQEDQWSNGITIEGDSRGRRIQGERG